MTQSQLQPALLRVSATISQYFTKPSNDVSGHHRILMRAAVVPRVVLGSLGIGRSMVHTCRDVAADNEAYFTSANSGTLHKKCSILSPACVHAVDQVAGSRCRRRTRSSAWRWR